MIYPRFIDVEASSLNVNSYPIEIAWSDYCGNIESHLINPSGVDSWTDWDFYAQHKIHGISKQMCYREGVDPEWLCNRLYESIEQGDILYADGGTFDEFWVDELFGAGSTDGFAHFRIGSSDSIMMNLLRKSEADVNKRLDLFEALKIEARKIVNGHHRADVDVSYLIELYKLCHSFSMSV